jgi:peptidoglycan L-alanyl-D-glutamate endopeptidase CwlK
MKKRNKYNFGKSSKRRLSDVSDYLQLTARRALICSPIDFGVSYMGGKRTAEQQNEIFKKGHSNCDGYKKISFHQKTNEKEKGLALDLVPYISGEGLSYKAHGRFGVIGMLMLEAWQEHQDEGEIPEGLFLHWGGLWSHKDPLRLGWDLAHYEIRDYEQIEMV